MSLERCPHFRGVSLERCPHFKGVLSFQGCVLREGFHCRMWHHMYHIYIRIDNLNKPVAPTMKARNGGTVGVASVEQLQKNVYKYLTTRYN